MNYFSSLTDKNYVSIIVQVSSHDVLTKSAPVKLSYVNFSVSKNGLFSFRLKTFAGSR